MGYNFRIGVIGSATSDIRSTLQADIEEIRRRNSDVDLTLVYSFRSPASFRKAVIDMATTLQLSIEPLDEIDSTGVRGDKLGTMCDAIILIGTDNRISVGVAAQFEERSKGPVYRHDH